MKLFNMTNFKRNNQVFCKMTHFEEDRPPYGIKPNLLRHLTFGEVFNKNLRASEAGETRESSNTV